MVTNQTISSTFEISRKKSFNVFSIKEHTVESEESWDGLEFARAVQDKYFLVD